MKVVSSQWSVVSGQERASYALRFAAMLFALSLEAEAQQPRESLG